MLRKWEDLPDFMRIPEVRPYWEVLNRKRGQLVLKRLFDLTAGLLLSVILAIPMAVISVLIKNPQNDHCQVVDNIDCPPIVAVR